MNRPWECFCLPVPMHSAGVVSFRSVVDVWAFSYGIC